MVIALVAEIHRHARSLFHAGFGKIRPARPLPLLPPSNVTTDAPATVAGLHGPDLPARHATAGSVSALSPAEVFDALESSPRGLAAARAAASRLAALGPDELRAAKRPPVIRKVLAQFTNPFALVLLGALVITFASFLIQSPLAGAFGIALVSCISYIPPCKGSSAPPASPCGTGSCSSASASRRSWRTSAARQ